MSSAVLVTLHLLWPSVCWLALECGGSQKSSTRRTLDMDSYWRILTHTPYFYILVWQQVWSIEVNIDSIEVQWSIRSIRSIRSISGDNELRKGGSVKSNSLTFPWQKRSSGISAWPSFRGINYSPLPTWRVALCFSAPITDDRCQFESDDLRDHTKSVLVVYMFKLW